MKGEIIMTNCYKNFKFFKHTDHIIYYNIKDVDIKLKEKRGMEMASAYMEVLNEKYEPLDVFKVYDEKYKILYAMPIDAQRWYGDRLKEKSVNNVF